MGKPFFVSGISTLILDGLLDRAMAIMDADMGNIQLLDRPENALRIVASRGFELPFLEFFAVVDCLDHSACASALHTGSRIVVSDIDASPYFAGKQSGEIMREAGVRAVQSTPIIRRDGSLIGMISTHWRTPFSPNPHDLTRLDSLIARTVEEIALNPEG